MAKMSKQLTTYLECLNCGQIEPETTWGKGKECLHCAKLDYSTSWPSKDVTELINFILSYEKKSPNYGQVTCVFLSCTIELLLEQVLVVMAFGDLLYEEAEMIVHALIDGYRGKNRMLTLYGKLGYCSFHEEISGLGKVEFLRNWDTVVKSRNLVVHGRPEGGDNITMDLVEQTVEDALLVFSKLNNKYNTESLHYKSVMKI